MNTVGGLLLELINFSFLNFVINYQQLKHHHCNEAFQGVTLV